MQCVVFIAAWPYFQYLNTQDEKVQPNKNRRKRETVHGHKNISHHLSMQDELFLYSPYCLSECQSDVHAGDQHASCFLERLCTGALLWEGCFAARRKTRRCFKSYRQVGTAVPRFAENLMGFLAVDPATLSSVLRPVPASTEYISKGCS